MLNRIFIALVLSVLAFDTQAHAGKVGQPFQISVTPLGIQEAPATAALKNGGFVVSWISHGSDDASKRGIYARVYNAQGMPLRDEFQIDTKVGYQQAPAIAALQGGGFVVVWLGQLRTNEFAAYGQRYTANGARVGERSRIYTQRLNYIPLPLPSVAALNDGGFVVVWKDRKSAGELIHIFGQRYSAAGVRTSATFRVNRILGLSEDQKPKVAGLRDGGFVVAWVSKRKDHGIYGQRYNAQGARSGGEFKASSNETYYADTPSIAGLKNGGFVVTWIGTFGVGARWDSHVHAQRFTQTAAARAISSGSIRHTTI